jgi:hypothetical protein
MCGQALNELGIIGRVLADAMVKMRYGQLVAACCHQFVKQNDRINPPADSNQVLH